MNFPSSINSLRALPFVASMTMLCLLPAMAATSAFAADPGARKKGYAESHSHSNGSGIVRILSPDTEQTFSQFEIVAQRLYWSRDRQQLSADITFSNVLYADRTTRREDEPYSFRFPGAVLDPATGIITARASNGSRVVVARRVDHALGNSIRFAPYACVFIYNHHGKIAVELAANPNGAPIDLHWQVRGREFNYRNLLD